MAAAALERAESWRPRHQTSPVEGRSSDGEQVEEGAFAGAALADDGDHLAGADLEVEVAEELDGRLRGALGTNGRIVLAEVFGAQDDLAYMPGRTSYS